MTKEKFEKTDNDTEDSDTGSETDVSSSSEEVEEVEEIKEIKETKETRITKVKSKKKVKTENLIELHIDSYKIRQNPKNGYISMNDIIKIDKKKQWSMYYNKKSTKKFIEELMLLTNLTEEDLIKTISTQNRWIHPYIAINLCQWISPKVSVQISKFVYDYISESFLPSHFIEYVSFKSENKQLKQDLQSLVQENESLKKKTKQDADTLTENEALKKKLEDMKIFYENVENEKYNKKLNEIKDKFYSYQLRFNNLLQFDDKSIRIKNYTSYKMNVIAETNTLILEKKK